MTGQVVIQDHPEIAHVSLVTLANPGKLNAVSVRMWQELEQAFAGLAEREPELRAVLVRGLDGVFAAGADIEEFPSFRFEAASLRHYHEGVIAPALHALQDCDVPLVAQLEGVCVGGGLEIASCCDIRIAGRSTRFGAPIARLGFPMAPDELAAVARIADRGTACEMLLEARLLDASTALQRGLVQRVVDDEAVAAEAEATARRIAALPRQVARANKRTLRALARGASFGEAERSEHFGYAGSADHREGVNSFIEKRAPRFSGS
jgi:enoyl-CoA hydratase/carnithine racemase